jgi:hypothetical protein
MFNFQVLIFRLSTLCCYELTAWLQARLGAIMQAVLFCLAPSCTCPDDGREKISGQNCGKEMAGRLI